MNIEPTWRTVQEWALKQGINQNTVKSWRGRRVPHKHRVALMAYATRTGKPLIYAALDLRPTGRNGK